MKFGALNYTAMSHVAWQLHMDSHDHLTVSSHKQKWALANAKSQSPLCEAAAGKNLAC
jgi:hypothetical protein